MSRSHRSVIPGFGLSLGLTITYLSLIVLIPLSAAFIKTAGLTWSEFTDAVFSPRVLASYRITFFASLAAALVNCVFGGIVAWVLVRYPFPGRKVVDALVDLPFALPTAVAGLALTALYAPNGWLGAPLAALGVKVAYTPLGVALAMGFVGLPFVVRTVEPVLRDLPPEAEEAAATLGASRGQTWWRVVLPALAPALLAGFAMASARAIGEYGSVIFIAGNTPMWSEIAPLLIVVRLEQFDYAGAAAVGLAMLALSFLMLLALNLAQRLWRRA